MKALHLFNTIAILVLAGLCVAQWQSDQKLGGEITALTAKRREQETLITDQTSQLERLRSEFGAMQAKLSTNNARLEKTETDLIDARKQVRLLTMERDQLKDTVTNWMAAVTVRDERIKEGNAQIRKLADDLTASVLKFNELATNYNATVRQLNEVASNRNEMITRYNSLVEEVNKARAAEEKK